MMRSIINKRGSLADPIFAPIFLIIIAATMFICYFIWSQFAATFPGVMSANANVNNPGNATVTQAINDITGIYNTFDYSIPFIVGVMLILSLVFAFKRGAPVIYIGLAIVFWIVAFIMSSVYSNIFYQFSSAFPTVAVHFPILSYIMNNIQFLVLGWLFLISVVMFTRSKKEDKSISAQEMVFPGGYYQ
jgi:hypothetical protein